jgi:hypothetical protein
MNTKMICEIRKNTYILRINIKRCIYFLIKLIIFFMIQIKIQIIIF